MNKNLLFSLISACLLLSACEKSTHVESTTSSQIDYSQSSQSVSSSETNDENFTVIDENITSNKDGNYNISVNTGIIIINGKKIQQNDVNFSDDKKEQLVIKLSNELVKFSIDKISSLDSSLNIVQKCSDSTENYLMIDKSLVPYLSENSKNGSIHLKNGSYKILGKIKVELYTQSLTEISHKGTGDLQLNCIDKNIFNLKKYGTGNIHIPNVDNESMSINQSGTGKVSLDGQNLKKLEAYNKGVGSIYINLPVFEAHIQNSGVGSVSAQNVDLLSAENAGVGEINVNKVNKIIHQKSSGIGSINTN